MASDQPDECVLHFPEYISEQLLVKVTERKWKTATERSKDWIELKDDQYYNAIAVKVLEIGDFRSDLRCHEYCYKKYTNSGTVQAAQRRAEKRTTTQESQVRLGVCLE